MNKWLDDIKGKFVTIITEKPLSLSKLQKFWTKDKPPSTPCSTVGPSRPMKFPYTFAAKLAQFPYKFYFQNSPLFRYYCYGVIASVPVFIYISGLSNSPANKEKWAEIRRKEHEEYAHKFD